MTNPRDFLPAKYKKQTDDSSGPTETPVDSTSSVPTTRDIPTAPSLDATSSPKPVDSPWADLAKADDSPSYPDLTTPDPQLSSVEKADETDSAETKAELDVATGDNQPPHQDEGNVTGTATTPIPSRKKANSSKLAGILVVFFLVIGLGASFFLMNQSQDVRQQAGGGCFPSDPHCNGSSGQCKAGYAFDSERYCVPLSQISPTPTPVPVAPYHFGWSYGGTNCTSGGPATNADWENTNCNIAGTYVHNGKRYVIGLPDTLEAAVSYANQNPQITHSIFDANGSGNNLQLAPFKRCGNGIDYNTIDCTGRTTVWLTINGQQVQVSYLTPGEYTVMLQNGETWVPSGTGCGEGATVGGVFTDAIDCTSWHFTVCLNPGTGVNGLGCDIAPNTPNEPGEPNEPPGTTTTPPPTGTPTPTRVPSPPVTATPTPPPSLVCTDIEMLDAAGNIMTDNDDDDLRDGDQVRFRASSAGDAEGEITYEFRILPPNIYSWIDLTNTNPGSSANNVSAPYTIISSGHHIVQSRVCLDGECFAWDPKLIAKNPPASKTSCIKDSDCASDEFCYVDPTPSGAQTFMAAENYCKKKDDKNCYYQEVQCFKAPCDPVLVCNGKTSPNTSTLPLPGTACETDAECAGYEYCYQPPMPTCSGDRSCSQVMPPKYCAARPD